MKHLIPMETVAGKILLLRGQKVILDKDLAVLYGVRTFNLNKAVKRNLDRFPQDFMFQVTAQEYASLIFHFGISKNSGRGGTRHFPYAFTEQGVAMLSSVLRSRRAIEVNIMIMRAFVKLRSILASHGELAAKLEELEKKYDAQFKIVFDAIRQLMAEPSEPPKRKIGFTAREGSPKYEWREKLAEYAEK